MDISAERTDVMLPVSPDQIRFVYKMHFAVQIHAICCDGLFVKHRNWALLCSRLFVMTGRRFLAFYIYQMQYVAVLLSDCRNRHSVDYDWLTLRICFLCSLDNQFCFHIWKCFGHQTGNLKSINHYHHTVVRLFEFHLVWGLWS